MAHRIQHCASSKKDAKKIENILKLLRTKDERSWWCSKSNIVQQLKGRLWRLKRFKSEGQLKKVMVFKILKLKWSKSMQEK